MWKDMDMLRHTSLKLSWENDADISVYMNPQLVRLTMLFLRREPSVPHALHTPVREEKDWTINTNMCHSR